MKLINGVSNGGDLIPPSENPDLPMKKGDFKWSPFVFGMVTS
jgi:hypothetical protein